VGTVERRGLTESLRHYRYRGARALVLLHGAELRRCLTVWRQAKALNVALPETTDEDYASLEHLLVHLLRAARAMGSECVDWGFPTPVSGPRRGRVEREADGYLEHILARWRLPLADVPETAFEPEVYRSNWGTLYCLDAMLEHAVMHPMRHRFQLEELLAAQR
jgi:hypothetical protein